MVVLGSQYWQKKTQKHLLSCLEAVILLIMCTWAKHDVGLVNVPLHLDS